MSGSRHTRPSGVSHPPPGAEDNPILVDENGCIVHRLSPAKAPPRRLRIYGGPPSSISASLSRRRSTGTTILPPVKLLRRGKLPLVSATTPNIRRTPLIHSNVAPSGTLHHHSHHGLSYHHHHQKYTRWIVHPERCCRFGLVHLSTSLASRSRPVLRPALEDFERYRNSPARTRVRPWAVTLCRRAGSRAPRESPLTDEDLYVGDERPPASSSSPIHECGICFNIQSHPVRYLCGHGHCYTCIRQWLEVSWACPSCRAGMIEAPMINLAKENAIRKAHPDFVDNSTVTYSWEGLRFPIPSIF
ncbi:hypothetical protein C8R45DRAFT_1081543 [Mycena sanguinolenta]|nr:hypothetical protein C8R45DRAFT_1081543 [Mycena sanguinolenta]